MEYYSTLCDTIWMIIMCVKDLLDMIMKNGDKDSQYLQNY